MQLQLCETSPQCDPAPLETRLLRLDPENGVVWTYALQRADHAKDQAARATAFYGLAQSRRIDVYWSRIVSHLAAASTGTAGFDAGAALTQIIGIESTFSLAFAPVTGLCLVPRLQPDMLDSCRQIASAFQKGDTAVVEAYGSSLALNLWPTQFAATPGRCGRAPPAALPGGSDGPQQGQTQLRRRRRRLWRRWWGITPPNRRLITRFYTRLGLKPDPPDSWKDPTPGR